MTVLKTIGVSNSYKKNPLPLAPSPPERGKSNIWLPFLLWRKGSGDGDKLTIQTFGIFVYSITLAIMHFPDDLQHKYELKIKKLDIKLEDIEEHHTRGGGHGGQKINKSTNCVELTHEPTGITVRFQHHRGLHQNRKDAYELLIDKIEEEELGVESELAQKHHKVEKQKQRRSRRSKQKMLEEKHHQSEKKESRKKIEPEEEV